MNTSRTYHGKITAIEHINTTAFGMRTFKVHFKSGCAYYELSCKRTLNFSVGDSIEFKGYWIAGIYFYINTIVDVRPMGLTREQIDMLYHQEHIKRMHQEKSF